MAFLFLLGYLVFFMFLYMSCNTLLSEDILDDEYDDREVVPP